MAFKVFPQRLASPLAKWSSTRISRLQMETDYFAEVQDLLRLEADAIARTADRLDRAQVQRVIELITTSVGKVVILGVGKS